jgi:hypothetical protein
MLVQGINGPQRDQEYLAGAPNGSRIYMCFTFYNSHNSNVVVAQLGQQAGNGETTPYVVTRTPVTNATHQISPVGCTVSVAASDRVWTACWGPGHP